MLMKEQPRGMNRSLKPRIKKFKSSRITFILWNKLL